MDTYEYKAIRRNQVISGFTGYHGISGYEGISDSLPVAREQGTVSNLILTSKIIQSIPSLAHENVAIYGDRYRNDSVQKIE